MAEYEKALQDRLVRLGKKVRERRIAIGLSQEQLAEVAGMHRTYIGSVERGERNISVGSLHTLADALNVQAGTLL